METRMHSILARSLERLHTPKLIFDLLLCDQAIKQLTFHSWQSIKPAYDILDRDGSTILACCEQENVALSNNWHTNLLIVYQVSWVILEAQYPISFSSDQS